jgi:hypothetical protein
MTPTSAVETVSLNKVKVSLKMAIQKHAKIYANERWQHRDGTVNFLVP